MNKKIWFTLLAVLMISAMVLGACGQKTAEPTEVVTEEPGVIEPTDPYADVDPSGETIYYWHQHSRSREEALLEIVTQFNETNEWGITVVAEYQGGYPDIFNKMLGVVNTTDAPNVVVAYQNQAATYQLVDGMTDMNPLVNSEKWGLTEDEQKDFFAGFFAQDVFPTYNNQRLGIPPNRSMEVLYYNKDWLTELGYDAPPATPEEFKEMACKAAATPFSKATVEGSMGYQLSIDASRFASWTFAFGGDVFDYNTSQYNYNNDSAKAAMAFIQDLFDSGCAANVTERYGDQSDFGNGSLLFTVGSSSGLPYYRLAIEDGAGFEWSVAAIPHTTADPVMNIYGASISIPKSTPEKQLAAWLFLKFYTSPEIQAKWAMASNYFPVRHSVADGLGDYFSENPQYQTAYDMLQYGRFEPPVPGYDFVRIMVREAMAAIADGADVASTLDELNTEANIELAEQLTSPLPTPVPTDTPEPPTVGSEEYPIKVLFVPSVDAAELVSGGELLAQTLHDATGLYFEVSVPTSYAATIEEMCASPDNTMGFIPGLGYVLANNLCGVEVTGKAVRYGYDWYTAMVVVQRDSDITTLEDLNGKKWAYPDTGSTSGYLYPIHMFQDAGVEPGETVEAGGHTQAISSVYNGEVDFATAFYSPPRVDGTAIDWEPGQEPDAPADLVDSCATTEDQGKILCGNWEPRDARRNIRKEVPDAIQKLRILAITAKIPNDTISFGPEFPADVRDQIMQALFDFAENDADGFATAMDPYSWTSINPATDAEYDPIRLAVQASGFSLEDLGE